MATDDDDAGHDSHFWDEIGHRAPCGRGRPSLVPSSVARDIDVGVFHRRRRQRESVPALSPEQV